MRQSEGAVVMKYINQLEHRDIPYEHNLDHGGVPEEKRNVAAAGCGPSCLCMMVDALTLSTYELTDCLKLSNEVGAKPSTALAFPSLPGSSYFPSL